MADRGKRLIFSNAETIESQEGIAATATILPGMSLLTTATGVTPDSQADTVVSPLIIADYNFLQAGTVDDAWDNGSSVVYRQLPTNKRANVRVSSGNNITRVGQPLARDGSATAGHLKIAASGDVVVAVSDEIINVTADGLVRVRGV